jgi:hypothetical protein
VVEGVESDADVVAETPKASAVLAVVLVASVLTSDGGGPP